MDDGHPCDHLAVLSTGDVFAHYEIEGLLGEGGMGRVYRAFDTRLHRRVALKLLLLPEGLDRAARSEAAARMIREARAAAAVDHPNKVGVFELGEVDGAPYLAMEYIAGTTLRAWVGDRSAPLAMRLGWLVDAARALDAAHVAGLVHRDIKPENVMLRDDGVVKVLDFGIARRAAVPADPSAPTAAPAGATLTGAGVVIGTAAYMPPEQIQGHELDGRADQFAWGVMAFEVLTGQHPWGAASDALALVGAMLTKPARRASSIAEDVPPDVDALIARTLSANRDDRYPRMNDIVAVLAPISATNGGPTRSWGGSKDNPAKTVRASFIVSDES